MRRRGSNATDHAEVADDAPCCAVCRDASPPCECELGAEEWMRESLRVLARNLRDAAGCALAVRMTSPAFGRWRSNCDGRAAPGWER